MIHSLNLMISASKLHPLIVCLKAIHCLRLMHITIFLSPLLSRISLLLLTTLLILSVSIIVSCFINTSGWEVLLFKLADGSCWVQMHTALVGLIVQFSMFFQTYATLFKCGLDFFKKIPLEGIPLLPWPLSLTQSAITNTNQLIE